MKISIETIVKADLAAVWSCVDYSGRHKSMECGIKAFLIILRSMLNLRNSPLSVQSA